MFQYKQEIVTTYNVEAISVNFVPVETVLKVRRERTCHKCGRLFTESAHSHVGLAFTDRGNKLVCGECAREIAESGSVEVTRLVGKTRNYFERAFGVAEPS